MSITVQQVKNFLTKELHDSEGNLLEPSILKMVLPFNNINQYPGLLKELIDFIELVKNDEETFIDDFNITGVLKQFLVTFVNKITIDNDGYIDVSISIKQDLKLFRDLIKLENSSWLDENLIKLILKKNFYYSKLANRLSILTAGIEGLFGIDERELPDLRSLNDIINYSLIEKQPVYLNNNQLEILLTKKENADIIKATVQTNETMKNIYRKPGLYIICKYSDQFWKLVPNNLSSTLNHLSLLKTAE